MLKPASTLSVPRELNSLSERLTRCEQFPAMLPLETCAADPWHWLNAQPFETKTAWSDRKHSRVIAGVGVATRVTLDAGGSVSAAIDECRRQLSANGHQGNQVRFFGGLSFNGQAGWQEFGAGQFVVPRFLLEDGQIFLTVMDREDIAAALDDYRLLEREAADEPLPELAPPRDVRYAPTRDGWLSTVDEALTLIRSEVLEKVVLARKTTLEFAESVNPWQLSSKLFESTYDCYLFAFQFGGESVFLGATPERLFHRHGRRLHSEVIAGTRRRGVTTGEDQRLAYDLLSSEKDQLEHDIVRKSIRQKLHKFVEHLSVDSHASVLRLAHKQHLCSTVEGDLKPGIDEGKLLERLHPTPAVGGYPTENALPEIARLEPFDRGWYAAPVGWIGAEEAEFVVGIRSGLVKDHELRLYSGAGIVHGSDPTQEWDEVENKIRGFIDLFQ